MATSSSPMRDRSCGCTTICFPASHRPDIEGRVILGTPDLYAAFLLPSILQLFRSAFPTSPDRAALRALDAAGRTRPSRRGRSCAGDAHERLRRAADVVGQEQLVWLIAAPTPMFTGTIRCRSRLLPPGNVYRDYAIEGLERVGRTWHIACVSDSVARPAGRRVRQHGGDRAGRSAMVPGMREIGVSEYFPAAAEGRPAALPRRGRTSPPSMRCTTTCRIAEAGDFGADMPGAEADASRIDAPRLRNDGHARQRLARRLEGRGDADDHRPRQATDRRFAGRSAGRLSNPQGTLAAGRPARLIGHENGDQPRCWSTGSALDLDPRRIVPAAKAVTATVGVTKSIASENRSRSAPAHDRPAMQRLDILGAAIVRPCATTLAELRFGQRQRLGRAVRDGGGLLGVADGPAARFRAGRDRDPGWSGIMVAPQIRRAYRRPPGTPRAPRGRTAAYPQIGREADAQPGERSPAAGIETARWMWQADRIARIDSPRSPRASARRPRPFARSGRCAPAIPTTEERSRASAARGRRSA